MKPHGLSSSFPWSQRDECCWVKDILLVIPAPSTKNGTTYILQGTISEIEEKFRKTQGNVAITCERSQ
jgi:hypothetical protein